MSLNYASGRCRCRVCAAVAPRDRPAVVLERDAVGLRSAADAGLERVDGSELLACQLEVKDVEVLRDALTSTVRFVYGMQLRMPPPELPCSTAYDR